VIVCICNGIRERDVRHAARNGATTPCAAYSALGQRARCGQCSQFAREIIRSERHAA
jgi:bacterioferritin-associated ferredoxin